MRNGVVPRVTIGRTYDPSVSRMACWRPPSSKLTAHRLLPLSQSSVDQSAALGDRPIVSRSTDTDAAHTTYAATPRPVK